MFFSKKPSRKKEGERIPCVFLAYGSPDIIKASLDSFVAHGGGMLDIHILHNPGDDRRENEAIDKICRQAFKDGAIASYATYATNISNNAYLQYVLAQRQQLMASRHIMLTDGDILLSPGTIEEELRILATHDSLFACGARMDAARWSDEIATKEQLVKLHDVTTNAKGDYTSSATGIWAVLFRTAEFFAMIDRLIENDRRFTDANLKIAARWALDKGWVATKKTASRELNRESTSYVADRADAHVRFSKASPEPSNSRYAMWNHNLFSPAKVVSREGTRTQPAASLRNTAPRYIQTYEQGVAPAVAALQQPIKTAYLHREVPTRNAPPGLHLCYEGAPVRMSWPSLWPEKAIAWISLDKAFHASQPVCDVIEIDRALATDGNQLPAFLNLAKSYVKPGGSIIVWLANFEPGLTSARRGERRRFAKLGTLYALSDVAEIEPEHFMEKLNDQASAFWSLGGIERWCVKNGTTFSTHAADTHPLAAYTTKVVIQR
jgi:hypothetical protein